MNRREFLKTMLGAGAAAGAFMLGGPFGTGLRFAQAAVGKTVVAIYQRGGCDGLNAVVPYNKIDANDNIVLNDDYYTLRPTIGIAPPNPGDPESAVDLDGIFGLHPGLGDLLRIWNNGDLAILPTVQYPNASRSHFDSQHFIESAASSDDRNNKENLDGWLNRHMATHSQAGNLRAVSFGSSVAQSLRGQISVSSFGNMNNFKLGFNNEELETLFLDRMAEIYGQPADPSTAYRRLLLDSGNTMIDNLEVIRGIDIGGYTPQNGAVYPNTTFGLQLKQIAQLIKEDIGLEIATVGIGGWDTHKNQGDGDPNGTQAKRFKDFAGGIAALYTDLGNRMADAIILTMTEFGRTAKENGSFGTDHGNASTWMVAGGGTVDGGIYGEWPGLETENLYRQRYLQHTVDYRNVMGEILTEFMGNPNISVVYTDPAEAAGYEPLGLINSEA